MPLRAPACPCVPIDGFIIGPGPPLSEFDD
jgi:hypothetical protein